jgi:hypothetical protein
VIGTFRRVYLHLSSATAWRYFAFRSIYIFIHSVATNILGGVGEIGLELSALCLLASTLPLKPCPTALFALFIFLDKVLLLPCWPYTAFLLPPSAS